MHPYKVVHLSNPILERNDEIRKKGNVDAMGTSRQLEALLVEEHKNGYELVSITPLSGTITRTTYTFNTTIGLLVTFKKKETP